MSAPAKSAVAAVKAPPKRASAGSGIALLAGSADLARLDALLGAIYDGPMETPPWGSALEAMKAQMSAAHVTLMLRPPSSDHSGVMINTGIVSPQATQSYETHFFAMDPFVHLNEGDVVTAEELIGKQWLQSQIYNEFMKPLNIRHLLGADIYTKDGIECRLRVTRSHDAKPFNDADKALVRFVLPHFKRSIQLHARLDLLETERQLFAGTVNRMLLGLISFAPNGAIMEINQEAQRILGEKDGISLSGNNISLDVAQESREFQRILKQALAETNSGPAVAEGLSVTRPSGRSKLGVLIKAIPPGPFTESRQRPAVAVFLRDPESNVAQPSNELLRKLFGLTRMEAALAVLLTEGYTLDEAAEKMDVRRNTARTHLRSIFCKTGVTRQTMLVRLLLNSVITLG